MESSIDKVVILAFNISGFKILINLNSYSELFSVNMKIRGKNTNKH